MPAAEAEFMDVAGVAIAFRRQPGRSPGAVWLGGYRSDMLGTKAEALADWAATNGRAFLRHDYSGHGESGGAFRDGTISTWLGESLAVLRASGPERAVLVGSSMGAWIALRMAQDLRRNGEGGRIAGLVLIAPAPDFTTELMEPKLSRAQKKDLAGQGFFEVPSGYSADANVYTRALFEDGARNRVMTGPIDTHSPVHIIQGLEDPDVPHTHALKLASMMPADDVTVSLVPGGDHRLSRPEDIDLIVRSVDQIISRAG
ncbi:MAG: alpha/beta hydrolase [Rhizobiaceae bacterium]|nr:alpha/beta hydrolase [Rhizobiaceae bacterium]